MDDLAKLDHIDEVSIELCHWDEITQDSAPFCRGVQVPMITHMICNLNQDQNDHNKMSISCYQV